MAKCPDCKHCVLDESLYYGCELRIPENNQYTGALENCEFFCDKNAKQDKIEGKKYDTGKNRMGLMCENFSRALWEVAKVSTFGANKYGANNWQKLENPKDRYTDALCRHLFQHLQGKKVDDESGLLHLSHCAWNALCLLEFELKDTKESENKDE